MEVRTRMAPSPTGQYHIGQMRTHLYNYALAKKYKGKFILRIEDTDRERLVPGAVEKIEEVINDYGLGWDEGPVIGGPNSPYVQSERLDIYKKFIQKLLDNETAYYCFCSKERLDSLREEQKKNKLPVTKYDKHCLHLSKEEIEKKLKSGEKYVIRLNVPENQEVVFTDEILGEVKIPTNDIDDQVLLKSDGFPTYHLAVVIDDNEMGVTHVLRGVEWLPSTPKHILLYKAFGWETPKFAHLPLLKEINDTHKMSKRKGATSAEEFLKDGYLVEALLNFLMFLGWNPGTEKEIYTLDEFINDFSLERIQKTALVSFDREKLLWMNGHYIRELSVDNLFEIVNKWAKKYNEDLNLSEDEVYNKKVLGLVQERLKTLKEFKDLTSYFFTSPTVEKELLASYSDRSEEIIKEFIGLYKNLEENKWEAKNLDEMSHKFIEQKGYKPKEAFMTIRVAVTGSKFSPPLFEVLYLLGKKEVLTRLENC